MGKRKKSKREYKFIGFKAFRDTDADLVDWWEEIEEGERSDVIRDAIRDYLRLRPRVRSRRIEIPELLQVREDAAWIRSALNEMPVFIERMVQQVMALQPVARAPDVVRQPEVKLNAEEKEHRTNRLGKATW